MNKQKEEKLTNRDLATFLHNAELTTSDRVDSRRIPILKVWKRSFLDETKEWVRKGYMSTKEIIFVLASVAKHLQDEVMREEDKNKK